MEMTQHSLMATLLVMTVAAGIVAAPNDWGDPLAGRAFIHRPSIGGDCYFGLMNNTSPRAIQPCLRSTRNHPSLFFL